jgi:hypothetical protein
MNKLVSRNLSTQLERQASSPLEKRVEGVPVMHLIDGGIEDIDSETEPLVHTHLSQHMLVKLWMDDCKRACACWVSIKDANSFCAAG